MIERKGKIYTITDKGKAYMEQLEKELTKECHACFHHMHLDNSDPKYDSCINKSHEKLLKEGETMFNPGEQEHLNKNKRCLFHKEKK